MKIFFTSLFIAILMLTGSQSSLSTMTIKLQANDAVTNQAIKFDSIVIRNQTTGIRKSITSDLIDLDQIFTGVRENPLTYDNSENISKNYPNPFDSKTDFQIFTAEPTELSFILCDINGNQIYSKKLYEDGGMLHTLTLTATALESGVYFLKVLASNSQQSIKLLKIGSKTGTEISIENNESILVPQQKTKGANREIVILNSNVYSFTCFAKGYQNSAKNNITISGKKSGDTLMFLMVQFGVPIDMQGYIYKTVQIGNQSWFSENLRVRINRNGDTIINYPVNNQNIRAVAMAYNGDSTNLRLYGRLYNLSAIKDYRGLAPAGWHIAKDDDWSVLIDYLGGPSIAGGKLKESGTEHWKKPNSGATDELGFAARPGGFNPGDIGPSFLDLNYRAYWWSAVSYKDSVAVYRQIYYDSTNINKFINPTYPMALSVRCVKNDSTNLSINGIIPDSAKTGEPVIISGVGFESFNGNLNISFNGMPIQDFTVWSDNYIHVYVPKGATSGAVRITVNDHISNDFDFTVLDKDYSIIKKISPKEGKFGDTVTITGYGFGNTRGTNYISFNGFKADNYVFWSDSLLITTVPLGIQSGNITVTLGTTTSNGIYFIYIPPPVITSITPNSGNIGDIVTISGYLFRKSLDSNYVSFNGADATEILSWSDTSITVKVPGWISSNNVTVTAQGIRSNKVNFTVLNSPYGSVTDIDGNEYRTIQIGTQVWMAENLKAIRYRNGDSIPNYTDLDLWNNAIKGAWRYYDDDPKYLEQYGRLYNWYTCADSRTVAPEGWHVPSDSEWVKLRTYLGGADSAGGKMKASGTRYWKSPNAGATNITGFSALPAGTFFPAADPTLGINTSWWAVDRMSNGTVININYFFGLSYNISTLWYNYDDSLSYGRSVRCIKDK